MDFNISSEYMPTGDQPQAIEKLVNGVLNDTPFQTLLGVTGSGKTFTMANVINQVKKPTLILSHNKTLAAQLYAEFKNFFPNNAVEYFVSYYDYYQPEAYLPNTDTYIEKDLAINDEIEKLRMATVSALLSGRRDVIVVSSVSCLYGMGNPEDYYNSIITISVGQQLGRDIFLRQLVDNLYTRNEVELSRGCFRVKGDTVDVFLPDSDFIVRVSFWGDDIDSIESIDPINNIHIESFESIRIYAANLFVANKDDIRRALEEIGDDLVKRVAELQSEGKDFEAKRLDERVNYDMEMIRELGHCSGIENYSRYFDRRKPGQRPFCILDYFPKDFLMMIDESHVTVPQIRAMYGGDQARKNTLVNYGFRLPAAKDNRPLKFEEFESMVKQIVFVSATPANYELEKSGGVIVEQVIRPTGLLDPKIEVRPSQNQIDDLIDEIQTRAEKDERVLVTTLTKRMAEELQAYLEKMGIRSAYIHSDVDTMDRVKILEDLRNGLYDVLVGVNLLREGLDLPEVSLVAILDADKEGFLRDHRSLTQTAGRAARNLNGLVIMYADNITGSMQLTIDETNRRRSIQMEYNDAHGIVPKALNKAKPTSSILPTGEDTDKQNKKQPKYYSGDTHEVTIAADPVLEYMSADAIKKLIENTKAKMMAAAKSLDFIEAAQLRDEMLKLQKQLEAMSLEQ
ncbi:MAG: excinuclease ABC subunit UvrB [Paludibacteraceae bacterium]|nr:excinuclease ABC subunit UvrB [Paludibacteraceae bacterium]